ncbi:unnamed protein product [Acidithrix sp. C25]|nr:unnamed protein product [Acidithrix sp. C25]
MDTRKYVAPPVEIQTTRRHEGAHTLGSYPSFLLGTYKK